MMAEDFYVLLAVRFLRAKKLENKFGYPHRSLHSNGSICGKFILQRK